MPVWDGIWDYIDHNCWMRWNFEYSGIFLQEEGKSIVLLVKSFFKQVNFTNKKANLISFLPSSPEFILYKLVFFNKWFCFS